MPQESIRVMIADEYLFYRRGLRTFLEEHDDITVVGEAGTSQEALSLVESTKLNVLMLDLELPPEGGLHVLSAINGMNIRSIVLTGPDDGRYLADAIVGGVSGCLFKNAEPPLILSAVREVGHGGTWLQQEMTSKIFEEFTRLARARREAPDRLLSNREVEVLTLLAQGLRNAEIANKLFISLSTVKAHITNLFRKLGLTDRVQATRYAIRHRLVQT